MSPHIPTGMSESVRRRANDCCEYCRLPQNTQEATFHIDHVQPRSTGGPTDLENLALACVTCSLRKAARETAVDPESGDAVRLYNPRTMLWADHFELTDEFELLGRTPIARATIEALTMNRSTIVLIRKELNFLGRFPKGDI